MSHKTFISADDLMLDSFRLARQVLDSGWRPDVLVALWRGGTPVAVAVHEFLSYHGIDTCHMAVKCSSYAGIGERGEVSFEYADPALNSIRPGQRVLVVDDIFDSGRTAEAVINRLDPSRVDVRLATVFWKPAARHVPRRPDYHVHTTEDWIVFPHELEGLTREEVRRKSAALESLLGPAAPRKRSVVPGLLPATILAAALATAAPAQQPDASRPHPAAATNTLRIMTSFYPMYVAALNVAQGVEGVEVRNLTPPHTGCLHDYQMTAADRASLAAAAVFIVNGAGMESFLDKVVRQHPSLRIVQASEGLPLIRTGDNGDVNPHVWLSVTLHIGQISNIMARLSQADPVRAGAYRANGAAYIARLERLRAEWRAGLRNVRTRDIITFHEAFPYLARELDLNVLAVIEREPGSEPGARDLARIIDLVRKSRAPAIFVEPQYPARSAQAIARETGVRLLVLDPAVSGPMRADAYLEIMTRNLAELRKALAPGEP